MCQLTEKQLTLVETVTKHRASISSIIREIFMQALRDVSRDFLSTKVDEDAMFRHNA